MSESQRGRFITVHGIDGTGKTTTTDNVVKQLVESGMPAIDYDSHKETRENPHKGKKKEANESGSLEERLAVYLESMMYHSDEIESLLSQGFHVVKSRYLDDIKAHFSHLGLSEEKIRELETKFPMVQPDLKVILLLEETERRKRITERGALNDRDLEEKTTETRLGFFEDYLLKAARQAPAGSILHVDTNTLNANQVAKKIVDHLINNL